MDDKKKRKKEKKIILPDEYTGQERTEPVGYPPRGMWYDPSVREGKSKNKPYAPSLNDALKFYIENPDKQGIPSSFDLQKREVYFDNKKKMSFEEIIKNYMQDSGRYKESDASPEDQWGHGGFMDSPVDVGEDPIGDFPHVKWVPRGKEDVEEADPDAIWSNMGLSKLDKTAQTPPLDRERLEMALYSYLENRPENYWYERWIEKYMDDFREEYFDNRGRLPSGNVQENVAERAADMSSADWFSIYGDKDVDSWMDEFSFYNTEGELQEDYPEIYEFYKRISAEGSVVLENFTVTASEFLTQDQRNQIAAKYGAEYISALQHYAQALEDGHPEERAVAYAVEELKKVDTTISEDILEDVANIYLTDTEEE